ncbi:protein of unknown function DUF1654 [Pseudomonas sp. GM30]|nr:protein of unknown function DUF1654 [Pseudomonas sp. GM30]
MGVIAEADELELILNDDSSVTVRWEQQEQDAAAKNFAEFDLEEAAPF